MQSTLGKSVGDGGSNLVADVRTVQDLLNLVPAGSGGPTSFLNVDGLAFGKTLDAIRRFQRVAVGIHSPDGRVDPGGKTLTKLGEFEKNGSMFFNIARFELQDVTNRTAGDLDLFYEISAVGSTQKVMYFFSVLKFDPRITIALPRLKGQRVETNTFQTAQIHSPFAFQSKKALHSEHDTSRTQSIAALSLPLPNDLLNIVIRHKLIIRSTQTGVQKTVHGEFRPIEDATGLT